MVELGILFTGSEVPQSDKITWVLTNKRGYLATVPARIPYRIWESKFSYSVADSKPGRSWYTYPTLVRGMFDLMTQYKDLAWTHATYLGEDETYSPVIMVGWGWTNLSDFNIEGQATLPNGFILKAIKPWYTEKYGSWNQSWWDGVVSGNKYRDPILLDWNFNEWMAKVYPAWDQHMHSMGKFSCHVGFINIDASYANVTSLNYNWGSYLSKIGDCDLILAYHFPCTISEAQEGANIAKIVRPYIRKKLMWLISTRWEKNCPTAADQAVQFEDYKAGIAGGADILAMTVYTDMGWTRTDPKILSEPRLLSFCTQTNTCPGLTTTQPPTSQPPTTQPPTPIPCNPDTEISIPSIGCVPKHYLVYGGLGFTLLMLLKR